MPSAARIPVRPGFYWPIYAAAVEFDLPVAIHVGAEGIGLANAPTGVGYPSTYLEYHTDHSLTMMAHCVSLVTDGAFEAFPSLNSPSSRGASAGRRTSCGGSTAPIPASRRKRPF